MGSFEMTEFSKEPTTKKWRNVKEKPDLENRLPVAFYRWALEDFQREIREGFPLLRQIKNSYLLTRQIPSIESLSPNDQQHLASVLVKRAHYGAVQSIGETISAEEWRVHKWYMSDIARIRPEEFRANSQLLHRINRKQFATLLKTELMPVLGDDVEPFQHNIWRYWTPVRHWSILTYVDIGGQHHQLSYSQVVTTKEVRYHPMGTSILAWLGISSQTIWDCLAAEDCPEAAKMLAMLCSHFIDAIEKITDE